MQWNNSAINSWISLIYMDDKTVKAFENGMRAITIWFTEDEEIIVKYYATLRNARIAAKNRYRNNSNYKISIVKTIPIIL